MPQLLMSSALLAQLGHLALASQSQVPMRVGDCVTASQPLEFFYKDEGEYERTHRVDKGLYGTLLNVDDAYNAPASVEWLNPTTREPIVNGAVFAHQFYRVPWLQGNLRKQDDSLCMTVKDGKDGYQPTVKMAACGTTEREKWNQQFTFNEPGCGARPIRLTENPGKCVDAVHPTKVLLTDCSGVDSQKFLFRCGQDSQCHLLAMAGRKDMCVWFGGEGDLQLRPCNFEGATRLFKQVNVTPSALPRLQTRGNTVPGDL
jgi:hypothetical protein